MFHPSWRFLVLPTAFMLACSSGQPQAEDPDQGDMTGGTAMAGSSAGPTEGTAGVGRYTVHEITLPFSEAGLANVWEDVTVSAVFTSPSGKAIPVKGFYHSQDTWKIRFAPSELGSYTYRATISLAPAQKVVDGSFECVASKEKGFVRASAENPLRLVFEDGSLYNALGVGSCDDNPHNADWGLDGGDRSKGEPEGLTDIDGYLKAMADDAKLNIYRWS